jgi:hypothetical protein
MRCTLWIRHRYGFWQAVCSCESKQDANDALAARYPEREGMDVLILPFGEHPPAEMRGRGRRLSVDDLLDVSKQAAWREEAGDA